MLKKTLNSVEMFLTDRHQIQLVLEVLIEPLTAEKVFTLADSAVSGGQTG